MNIFHGTCRSFDRFEALGPGPSQDECVYSETRVLGTFFSGHPRIAAHFTLKAEVLDAGYDSDAGSVSLCENPWDFDEVPFENGARVLACQVPSDAVWHPVGTLDWLTMCEEWGEEQLLELRAACLKRGVTGLRIEAWDGKAEHRDYGKPCVEYYSPTYVVFDASRVVIAETLEVERAWEVSGIPIPEGRMPPPSIPRVGR